MTERSAARILVVDDDLSTRAGLCELLQRAGYLCISAATFEAAKAILRSSPPDLLITDIRLGAFNGLQLVIEQVRKIPSIVMTAFDDHTLQAAARDEHALYLLKPVNPAELLKHVRQALGSCGVEVNH